MEPAGEVIIVSGDVVGLMGKARTSATPDSAEGGAILREREEPPWTSTLSRPQQASKYLGRVGLQPVRRADRGRTFFVVQLGDHQREGGRKRNREGCTCFGPGPRYLFAWK